jgi:endonuclease IV
MEPNYLEKIKLFSGISVAKICRELKIDRTNLLKGRTTKKNEKRVYEKLIEELKEVSAKT